MDWFKVEARIGSNEKVDLLSDRAFRALLHLWGYAMQHENDGRVPANAHRLIPRVSAKVLCELEEQGFIERNGNGWEIHDWHEHQADALDLQEHRRKERARLKEYRRQQKGANA